LRSTRNFSACVIVRPTSLHPIDADRPMQVYRSAISVPANLIVDKSALMVFSGTGDVLSLPPPYYHYYP